MMKLRVLRRKVARQKRWLEKPPFKYKNREKVPWTSDQMARLVNRLECNLAEYIQRAAADSTRRLVGAT